MNWLMGLRIKILVHRLRRKIRRNLVRVIMSLARAIKMLARRRFIMLSRILKVGGSLTVVVAGTRLRRSLLASYRVFFRKIFHLLSGNNAFLCKVPIFDSYEV